LLADLLPPMAGAACGDLHLTRIDWKTGLVRSRRQYPLSIAFR
jgi:hypothetical protein